MSNIFVIIIINNNKANIIINKLICIYFYLSYCIQLFNKTIEKKREDIKDSLEAFDKITLKLKVK